MEWTKIFSEFAVTLKNPLFFLNGTFAFSHRGEFESSNQPAPPSPTAFVPQTQVGYLTFDGVGGITGKITVNQYGGGSQVVNPTGPYTLKISNAGVATGTIETTSNLGDKSEIKIEYSFVVTDNWRELKYAVQKATVINSEDETILRTPKVLVWGTMRKIYS